MNTLHSTVAPLWRALGFTTLALGATVAIDAQAPGADERIEIAYAAAPQLQSLERHLQSNTQRASSLLGRPVQNRGGQSLGTVRDILVTDGIPSRGMSLVVAPAGAANGTAMPRVLSLAEIQISADGSELYADSVRAFSPDSLSPHVGAPQADVSPTRATADHTALSTSPATGSLAPGEEAPADRAVASLLGADVIGSDGRPAAVIDDLLISTAGIDSLRVILKVGGAGGEKRVALPFEQLEFPRSDRPGTDLPVRVSMDLQTLQRQPAFQYEMRTIVRR